MSAIKLIGQRLDELVSAFALLTCLPWPGRVPQAPSADAAWAYPLVGIFVGAIGGAVYWLAIRFSCPALLASVWAFVAMAVLTGGLHEDGIADFADSFGGRTKEARLAIMRDHTVGAYGVTALLLTYAIRITAVASLASPDLAVPVLIATGAMSRFSLVLVMGALPHARADGLAAAVGRADLAVMVIAAGIAFAAAWAVLSLPLAGLCAGAAIVAAAGVGAVARARLGGQTGDVLGATVIVSEALILTLIAGPGL